MPPAAVLIVNDKIWSFVLCLNMFLTLFGWLPGKQFHSFKLLFICNQQGVIHAFIVICCYSR
jgi:uncharacterized membrane protein YqaE (UPF0057 family)